MHYNHANNRMNSKYILGSIWFLQPGNRGKKLQKPEKCKGDFSWLTNYIDIKCKFYRKSLNISEIIMSPYTNYSNYSYNVFWASLITLCQIFKMQIKLLFLLNSKHRKDYLKFSLPWLQKVLILHTFAHVSTQNTFIVTKYWTKISKGESGIFSCVIDNKCPDSQKES